MTDSKNKATPFVYEVSARCQAYHVKLTPTEQLPLLRESYAIVFSGGDWPGQRQLTHPNRVGFVLSRKFHHDDLDLQGGFLGLGGQDPASRAAGS